MKRLNIFYLLLTLTLVLGSCGSSNVVNNSFISKRKYNKGFHINTNGHFKKSKEVAKVEEVKEAEENKNESVSTATTKKSKQSQVETLATTTTEEMVVEESVVSGAVAEGPSDESTTTDAEVVEREVNATEEEGDTDSPKAFKKKTKKTNNDSKGYEDAMFILAVICCIFIPPLGVGIYTNIDWMKVLICLLLTFLFFLPGMIYALLVVFDVI